MRLAYVHGALDAFVVEVMTREIGRSPHKNRALARPASELFTTSDIPPRGLTLGRNEKGPMGYLLSPSRQSVQIQPTKVATSKG